MGRSYDFDTILDAVELLQQAGLPVECVFVGSDLPVYKWWGAFAAGDTAGEGLF
tara:strand:+ start:833 stop:994 length:162 start_codon:yes stop_codon:yes gene_type:complete